MSKLYDLLYSVIGKVKSTEKSLMSVPKTVNGFGPDENGNVNTPEATWESLPDKPFGEGESSTVEITWDGDTSGRMCINSAPPFAIPVYRVSDLVVSKDELAGALVVYGQNETSLNEYTIPSETLFEEYGSVYDEYGFVLAINDGSEESGIYFASDMGRGYGRVFSMTLTTTSPIKYLDPKYLPDDHINSLIDAKLGVIENGTY